LLRDTEVSGEHFHFKAITRAFEAKASRAIAVLPAGPLALAVGADARHEELGGAFSPQLTSGDVIGSAATTGLTNGSRSVGATYAELNVPIAPRFEAQLAARYDHYSDFGGTTNPKIALRWQPAKAWLVRASYGTGFRAPTLADLDAPLSRATTAKPRDDPERCPSTRLPSDCNTQFDVLFGGNPDLLPEKSTQLNVGVVWEPLSGLSLDVDYWAITKTQTIGALTEDTLFNDFGRFATTNFRRGPAEPAFPALPGPIQSVFEGRQNFGNQRTSGVDVDVIYRGPVAAIGRFGIGLNGTYVARWQQQLNGVDYVSIVGRNVVGAIPRWRHAATLDWRYGAWSATLTQTFSAGYIDANLNAAGKERRVGAYDVWDAQGSYSGFRNTTFTLGVRNLFDRAPPFSNQGDQGQVMYDPRYADPRGRTFYAKLIFALP
jgi:iron complex outermembrane receptor protein